VETDWSQSRRIRLEDEGSPRKDLANDRSDTLRQDAPTTRRTDRNVCITSLSGQLGADARIYQEKDVKEAINKSKSP